MTTILKNVEKQENISIIKTNKFKNITVNMRFALEFSVKRKAVLYLLSTMMFESTKNHPDKVSFSVMKDMLYGFSCYASVNNYSNLIIYNVFFDFINNRFLKDIKENDYLAFIDEILKKPLFTQEKLNESRNNLISNIKRKLDNPQNLANDNFFGELIKDDKKFEIYQNSNVLTVLNEISLQDIEEVYKELFQTRIDIYLVGDRLEEYINYFNQYKSKRKLVLEEKSLILNTREDITFEKQVSQSTLLYAYTTPFNRCSEDYIAFNLGNIVFGGIPTSLLFSQVREKHSLCYSIVCISLKSEGVVLVKTMIDQANVNKVIEDIEKQFKRMLSLDYEDEILLAAKQVLSNNLLSIDDDLDCLLDHLYLNDIRNRQESIEEYIEKMNKITKEDIAKVFSRYQKYMIYFLKGVKNEENI